MDQAKAKHLAYLLALLFVDVFSKERASAPTRELNVRLLFKLELTNASREVLDEAFCGIGAVVGAESIVFAVM